VGGRGVCVWGGEGGGTVGAVPQIYSLCGGKRSAAPGRRPAQLGLRAMHALPTGSELLVRGPAAGLLRARSSWRLAAAAAAGELHDGGY
jgi:hypothetical protein